MAHRNRPLSLALLNAFAVILPAVAAQGCAVEDTDEVSANAHALTNQFIFLIYNYTRAATSFQVSVETLDQASGKFFAGNAFVPGGMVPPSDGSWDFMNWTQNGLVQVSQTVPFTNSAVQIYDMSDPRYRFANLHVTVTATINGACHTDSEDIPFIAPKTLNFSGWGATWNGSCWVGNLLTRGS